MLLAHLSAIEEIAKWVSCCVVQAETANDQLQKFFGTAFGLTTKVPISSFSYTSDSKKPTIHEADNGSGTMLHREFCPTHGSGILEVGEPAMKNFRYIMTGTLDHPGDLLPNGEFFCRRREKWMPEVPGTFHKQEIKD
jgi:hypothetical protein